MPILVLLPTLSKYEKPRMVQGAQLPCLTQTAQEVSYESKTWERQTSSRTCS